MKFYFILFIFFVLIPWVGYAQAPKTFPVLDTRIEKIKRPNAAALSVGTMPDKILTQAFFSEVLAFETGDTRLNLIGEEQLNQFIIQIDDAIHTFRKVYPTEPLILRISISEDEKWHCLLCTRRTDEIYHYLIERLVQAGNVQIQKEVIKVKMSKPQQLLSIISVNNNRLDIQK